MRIIEHITKMQQSLVIVVNETCYSENGEQQIMIIEAVTVLIFVGNNIMFALTK